MNSFKILVAHLLVVIITGFFLHEELHSVMAGLWEFAIYCGFFTSLWLTSFIYSRKYFRQFYYFILLMIFFIKELFISNLKIVWYVITPDLQFTPAVLALPLTVKSDVEIALLANLITLTPGTLTLEISDDHKFLFFHIINVPNKDPEEAKRQIKEGFEKRILKMTR
ncbi:MAG: Na+/H+ antiporter subunit E [Bacteroidia bacterium]